MGSDIFFVPSRFRDEMVEKKNPFTGEVKSVRPQEPLSDSELMAVREVLRGARATEPDEFGFCLVVFEDGGDAEVHTNRLPEGCGVTLRSGLSPDCLRFLFDLLMAAEWVMLPAMEGNPAIVSSPGLASEFAEDFTEVVCGSPQELGAILSGGYEAWERYRDQIVGDGTRESTCWLRTASGSSGIRAPQRACLTPRSIPEVGNVSTGPPTAFPSS